MTDILSSESAEERFSYIERVYLTTYDEDEKVEVTNARVCTLQQSAISIAQSEANCSASRAMSTLFEMGRERIRDNVGWDRVKRCKELNYKVHMISQDDADGSHEPERLMSNAVEADTGHEVPFIKEDGSESTTFAARDSLISEVDTNYVRLLNIDKSHGLGAVIGCGMYGCDDLGIRARNRGEKYVDSIEESIGLKEDLLLGELENYVKSRFYDWLNDGMNMNLYNRLMDVRGFISQNYDAPELVEVLSDIEGMETYESDRR